MALQVSNRHSRHHRSFDHMTAVLGYGVAVLPLSTLNVMLLPSRFHSKLKEINRPIHDRQRMQNSNSPSQAMRARGSDISFGVFARSWEDDEQVSGVCLENCGHFFGSGITRLFASRGCKTHASIRIVTLPEFLDTRCRQPPGS